QHMIMPTALERSMWRLDALRDMAREGADTSWLHFEYFDLVATPEGIWVAQDDWFPMEGEPDPLPDEWREVLAAIRDLGVPEEAIGEPAYDTVTDVWLWRIPLNLN
ncbi:MAG: hypothetical protein JWM19_236, partial [Actinomycetia bacterium]|nr:hypothetical protein [Actinomycetes bacterium]